jgi:proton-translocating NADH-quinone oxidoreductase chain M
MIDMVMSAIFQPLVIPAIGAVLTLVFPKRVSKYIALIFSFMTFYAVIPLYSAVSRSALSFEFQSSLHIGLRIDSLSFLMIALISSLSFLSTLYSIKYMQKNARQKSYYALMLLFTGCMNGTVMAKDFLTFFLLWEFMTLAAFFLIMFDHQHDSVRASIKYFIMSEMGALFMLLSIIGIYCTAGTLAMTSLSSSSFDSSVAQLLLLGFLIAAGTKAGMFPVHTWLPDAHPAAPSPVSALLSGAMIKVGIYLIFRIFFQVHFNADLWQTVLCVLGSLTIIIGVMMALAQHDAKRLLAYHSVSQVGYMVLGIGTGAAIGVSGGLFHMVNHALFKGLLFLCIGAVIYRTGTRDLDRMGGLARTMPLTFFTCLIAALSISGIPPLNGFASKWMIYQGIIEAGKSGGAMWTVYLAAAMLGSALTLASFVKVLHAAFLRKAAPAVTARNVTEVGWTMWLPMAALAAACIVFGIFAYRLPLSHLILPAMPEQVAFAGTWWAGPATLMLVVAFIIGLLVYFLSTAGKARVCSTYVGGEILETAFVSGTEAGKERDIEVTGVDFYRTVQEMQPFRAMYKMAEKRFFDLYDVSAGVTFFISKILKLFHTGVLTSYMGWYIVGLIALVLFLR